MKTRLKKGRFVVKQLETSTSSYPELSRLIRLLHRPVGQYGEKTYTVAINNCIQSNYETFEKANEHYEKLTKRFS